MSKRWTWRRREEPDDAVQIDGESGHEWWAGREALDRPIDRRWRRSGTSLHPHRRVDDPTPEERDRPVTKDRWDPSGLFTSTNPAGGTPANDDTSTSRHAGHEDGSWGGTASDHTTATSDRAGTPGGVVPWSILGLTSDASWARVVRRHRELAKEHHPDRHGVDDSDQRRRAEDHMASINAAFDDLGRIYRLTDDR